MNNTRLILFTTKDGLCSFSDTPIQWNHLSCLNKVLCRFYNCTPAAGYVQKKKIFVMGMNTFRNLKMPLPGQYYVLTRREKCPDNPNVIFCSSLLNIPSGNDFLDVWFIGSNSMLQTFFPSSCFPFGNRATEGASCSGPCSFCTQKNSPASGETSKPQNAAGLNCQLLKCHCNIVCEIVRIQVCLNSYDLWPTAEPDAKTTTTTTTTTYSNKTNYSQLCAPHCCLNFRNVDNLDCFRYFKYFKIPKNYANVSEVYKEYVYNDIVGQKTVERVCLFHISEGDRTSCGAGASCKNQTRNTLNCGASQLMSASDALGIYFTLGHVETIECQKGFPFFKQNFCFYEKVFLETMQFLGGDLNCTEFCANFGMILLSLYHDMSPFSAGLGELDDCAKININKNNLNVSFFNTLDTICLDTNFLNSLNCSFMFSYLPIQNFVQCRYFEMKLVFVPCFEDIQTNLLFYIPECTLIENFPYVVTSLSIMLFVIVHYINNHKVFVNSLSPGQVKIMIGKLYFMFGQEIFVQNYEYTPLLHQVFQKPLSCYLPTDFCFPIQ